MAKATATLASLKQEVEKFEKIQLKFDSLGADDTEPDFIFQDLVYSAFEGEPKPLPTDARGWNLYSDTPGTGGAANELSNQAARIIRLLGEIKISEMAGVKRYLQQVCWRIH